MRDKAVQSQCKGHTVRLVFRGIAPDVHSNVGAEAEDRIVGWAERLGDAACGRARGVKEPGGIRRPMGCGLRRG